jgi:hypothetical protein
MQKRCIISLLRRYFFSHVYEKIQIKSKYLILYSSTALAERQVGRISV